MPARILIFQGNNCSNKYFWFGVKKSCLIISAVSLTSSVMERWLYILHLVYSVIKKKKNLCCWFKNLRYWTCLTWSKYCSSPSWKRWCYSSRLRSTCVFDQTMTLFCEWIFWTITTSAYPGHWGSSIDFSHWVLWLFQIFICPLLLDSSTSLGLPVTNILDHRS